MTHGSEVCQPECMVISQLGTLGTEACKLECIAISWTLVHVLGAEVTVKTMI